MGGPAVFDRISGAAQFAGPLGDCHAFAVPFDEMGNRAVLILSEVISPFAIPWEVACIIIPTFKAIPLWARAHIGHERGKVIPSRVDGDPAGSIPFKLAMSRICASLAHLAPCPILTAFVESVFCMKASQRLSQFTSAGLCAGLQVVTSRAIELAAITLTFPPHTLGFPRGRNDATNGHQAAESLSGQIQGWASHIGRLYIVPRRLRLWH